MRGVILFACGVILFLSMQDSKHFRQSTKPASVPYEYARGWVDGYKDGHNFKPQKATFEIPKPPIPTDTTVGYIEGYKLGVHAGYNKVTKH
jgi:hypothetical protein